MPSRQMKSTREKLLAAGIKIFAEKGYGGATVRDICKEAGTANINSVNYYFGSKEMLYRKILELIFSEYDKFDFSDWELKTPREQLKEMILNFCKMLYKDNEYLSDIMSIFVAEMIRPSPFFGDLVDQYNRPRLSRHLKMFGDLLGKDASYDMVRDCMASVSAQLLYFSFAGPFFFRLFPGYSTDKYHEAWAEHVFEFSMGGIDALRKKIKKGKVENDGD